MVLTDPGGVPPNWRPVMDEESGDTAPLTSSEVSMPLHNMENPNFRFCRKCNYPKPPRCHHCSVCELIIPAFLYSYTYIPLIITFILLFSELVGLGCRWEVYTENGPSLCVGRELRWGFELQVLYSLPGIVPLLASYIVLCWRFMLVL